MKLATGFGLGVVAASSFWAWGIYRFVHHDIGKLGLKLVRIRPDD